MRITNSFAQKIVEKVSRNSGYGISMTDDSGTIIASYSAKNINKYSKDAAMVIKDGKTREILKKQDNLSGVHEAAIVLPLLLGSDIISSIIIEGDLENIRSAATIIKSSIETIIEYDIIREENRKKIREEEILISDILSKKFIKDDINNITSYHKMDYNTTLSRSVILIEIERKENKYFNINLDLGYDASIENLKDELIRVIKENRFLTNQDIVGFYGKDQIVIIKGFLTVVDTYKIYRALEKICYDILNDLVNNKIFSFSIAYGNVYSDITEMCKSYKEALEVIKLGKLIKNDSGVYLIDNMLLESVGYSLPNRIKINMILPLLEKLKKEDGNIDIELLSTIEALVDNCFNLSKTSKKIFLHRNTIAFRLEKFKSLTGLNPISSFRDAFLTKMAAIYVKLHKT